MKAVCFGDRLGIPQILNHLPSDSILALVAAELRPQYHEELAQIAQSHSLEFLVQPLKKTQEYPAFESRIKKLQPDLILVNSYSMLLHQELLDIPRQGCINIHGALLPQYRGCNPTQWAIINNEDRTGVTMHYMDAGFDTGDLIAQKQVPLLFEDTWLDIQQRIGIATEELLSEEVPKILEGTNSRTPQVAESARYWRRRKLEDGYFEWKWKTRDIYNLIRALVRPHPGAFYLDSDGSKVIIDQFMPYEQVKEMQKCHIGKVVE